MQKFNSVEELDACISELDALAKRINPFFSVSYTILSFDPSYPIVIESVQVWTIEADGGYDAVGMPLDDESQARKFLADLAGI